MATLRRGAGVHLWGLEAFNLESKNYAWLCNPGEAEVLTIIPGWVPESPAVKIESEGMNSLPQRRAPPLCNITLPGLPFPSVGSLEIPLSWGSFSLSSDCQRLRVLSLVFSLGCLHSCQDC